MTNTLAITIGREEITLGVIPAEEQVAGATRRFSTRRPLFDSSGGTLGEMFRYDMGDLCSAVGEFARDFEIGCVGLALGGRVDARGRLVDAIPHFIGQDVVAPLRAELDVPLVVVGQVMAEAAAEAVYGSHDGDFRFYWHTNSQITCVSVRKIGDRTRLVWGDIGHDRELALKLATTVTANLHPEVQCSDGKPGCFETFVCEAGVVARHGRRPADMRGSEWATMVGGWLNAGIKWWQEQSPTPEVVLGGDMAFDRRTYADNLSAVLAPLPDAPIVSRMAFERTAGLLGPAAAAILLGR